MLATYVIGLREGLEAALIVGIIAAFLRRQGRMDALRLVWVGVSVAVALCAGVAVTLQVISAELPTRAQEGLETVVAVLAVCMVTTMILWMRRHARALKGELERAAAWALEHGSAYAMVGMAFLAVLREGSETAVFLLAVLQQPGVRAITAGGGVIAGLVTAVVIGWGIYRGGVRLNLTRFFRATGVVLVLVAAGLVMSALHTAHEAGWLNAGQSQPIDIAWLVRPGTPIAALATGVLGLQPHPALAEIVGWCCYVLPMLAVVLRQPRRPATTPRVAPEVSATS
ncbi:iron permease FTR1 [Acidothermus cellulolyticus 11B]|uniref:Iron permease FTR1 n=1 Tax=Acidothermus cellulolyticus (strain ATCC 43068 / DSM 8971 / 11B) TaxID=351607 RepID=A0LRA2_ACIC1|nr:iron uptake transporter permease EfeU [Acidothermus cellulolyticus]ABK51962.1 iron permease FTR1 [Acidothermus cellulolyticus 11B]